MPSLLDYEQIIVFWTSVLISVLFYLLHLVSPEGPLNCISSTWFRYSFFFMVLILLALQDSGYDLTGFSKTLSKSCCSFDLAVPFLFILSAFAVCLLLSSAQSYLVKFQSIVQSHHIGYQKFISLHFGFIIIDFDESADMPCWHYFFYPYFGLDIQRTWLFPGYKN